MAITALASHTNNLTMGRGRVFFERLESDGSYSGERYLGATPGFSIQTATEEFEHQSAESGLNEVDDSWTTGVTRNATLTAEDVSADNLGLALLGDASILSQSTATVTDEAIDGVVQGRYYQLGQTTTNPAGVRALTIHTDPTDNIIVMDDAVATFVEGDDYQVDMDLGRIYIVPDGAIADGTNLEVSYKTAARSRAQVISGNESVKGRLRFIADNPKGDNKDVWCPSVRISPEGDISFKTGQELQTLGFKLSILKAPGYEAVYVDGRPYA